jgi:hypothetical protein
MALPLITVLAAVIVQGPVYGARATPLGTPVFDGPGKTPGGLPDAEVVGAGLLVVGVTVGGAELVGGVRGRLDGVEGRGVGWDADADGRDITLGVAPGPFGWNSTST